MSEEKKSKKKIDEAMVDKIVEETKQQKNLKEQIYDRINIPLPCSMCLLWFAWLRSRRSLFSAAQNKLRFMSN